MSDNLPETESVAAERAEVEQEPPNFGEWIQSTLAIMEYPATQGGVFCPQWWEHPEAVARFRALHQQYLVSRDKGEMSDWWVHHWDLHAKALFDPQTGVFRDCSAGHRPRETRRILDVTGQELEAAGFPAVAADWEPGWY